MAVEIRRRDLTPAQLRAAAGKAKDGRAARRMLAIALVLEGMDRKTAAESCGMDRQTLRDWVHRYNAEGLGGLTNRPSPGPPPRLTPDQKAALAAVVAHGPDPARDGVVRWRRIDLKRWIEATFGVVMHERTVGKQLAALGFVRLSVRPQHPKVTRRRRRRLKACPRLDRGKFPEAAAAVLPEHARGKPVEIWFQE